MKNLYSKWLAALLTALLAAAAQAETVTIQARYQPDQADFLDINPPGKMCVEFSYHCNKSWRAFAIDLPIEFSKPVEGFAAEPKDRYYINLPPPTRLTIVHDRTNERQEVTLQFIGLEMGVYSADPIKHPVNGAPPEGGGCTRMGGNGGGGSYKVNDWYVQATGPCYVSGGLPRGERVDTQTTNMRAIIRVDTPNPHRMKHGMWRGTLSYSVGNGEQIDLGHGAVVSRGARVDFSLELEVIHSFVLDFPPNSDKAVLQPDGGWARYWRGGPVPRRLYNEVPFRLWSSGPFKVYIECQRNMGTMCGLIHRPTTHQVPFSVALTLPPEHTHLGAPVVGQVLPVGQANALEFDSNATTWDRRGTLKYEVSGASVIAEMLENPGATYSGLVWIIFDAEL